MTKMDELTERAIEIVNKPYVRRLEPDDAGGYVASVQEFPGCIAEGNTAEEAISNLNNAALSWVEAALSTGYEVREPISFAGCSGKIALRIPRGLHQQVAELAEQEETSVNQLLVTAIAQYVGGHASERLLKTMLFEFRKSMSEGLVSFYRNSPWMLSISLPAQQPLLRADTFENQVVTAKTFHLGAMQQ